MSTEFESKITLNYANAHNVLHVVDRMKVKQSGFFLHPKDMQLDLILRLLNDLRVSYERYRNLDKKSRFRELETLTTKLADPVNALASMKDEIVGDRVALSDFLAAGLRSPPTPPYVISSDLNVASIEGVSVIREEDVIDSSKSGEILRALTALTESADFLRRCISTHKDRFETTYDLHRFYLFNDMITNKDDRINWSLHNDTPESLLIAHDIYVSYQQVFAGQITWSNELGDESEGGPAIRFAKAVLGELNINNLDTGRAFTTSEIKNIWTRSSGRSTAVS